MEFHNTTLDNGLEVIAELNDRASPSPPGSSSRQGAGTSQQVWREYHTFSNT